MGSCQAPAPVSSRSSRASLAFLLLGDVTPSWSSLTSSSASSPGLRRPLGAASSAARAFLGLGRVAGMVMGMATRGAGARTVVGAGSSPKGSGAGQLVKVDGAGLGWGGAGRALGALARLSADSGGLFLELRVLRGSRANGVLGTSSVGPPSSGTAALSRREKKKGFCEAGARGFPNQKALFQAQPCVPPSSAQSGLHNHCHPIGGDPNVVPSCLGSKHLSPDAGVNHLTEPPLCPQQTSMPPRASVSQSVTQSKYPETKSPQRRVARAHPFPHLPLGLGQVRAGTDIPLLALVLGFRPRPRALAPGSSVPRVPPSLLSPVSLLVFRLRRLALGTRRAGEGSAPAGHTDGGSGPGLCSPGHQSIVCRGGQGLDDPVADPTWPCLQGLHGWGERPRLQGCSQVSARTGSSMGLLNEQRGCS